MSTAVETALCYNWLILVEVLPYLDLVIFDVKLMDEERHKSATGV